MIETLDFQDVKNIIYKSESSLNMDLAFIEESTLFNSVFNEDGDDKDKKKKGFFAKVKDIFRALIENLKKFVENIRDAIKRKIEIHKLKVEIKKLREMLKENPHATVKSVNIMKQERLLRETASKLMVELESYRSKMRSKGSVSLRDAIKLESKKDKIVEDSNIRMTEIKNNKVDVPVTDIINAYTNNIENLRSGTYAVIETYERSIEAYIKEIDEIVDQRREEDFVDYEGTNKTNSVFRSIGAWIKSNWAFFLMAIIGCVVAGLAVASVASAYGAATAAGAGVTAAIGKAAVASGPLAINNTVNATKALADVHKASDKRITAKED